MIGIMDLPTELRLDIYERVLGFSCPIKRIKQVDAPGDASTSDPEDEVAYEPPIVVDSISLRADVAILLTCRHFHDEALPVLYKVNTMTFGRDNTCFSEHNHAFTDLDREFLQQAVILDGADTCTACPYSGDIPNFLKSFHPNVFPRLEKVTLLLLHRVRDSEFFSKPYEAHRVSRFELIDFVDGLVEFNAFCGQVTEAAGVDAQTDLMDIGCMELRTSSQIITFCYSPLAEAWQRWCLRLSKFRRDNPGKMAALMSRFEWLDPDTKMDFEMCERMTWDRVHLLYC